ncbi:MAG TPA: cation:proton antiporter [Coriobacteriia bacterium]|nr:cation:proton antiporter [Coriobacteriia bacterium]
MSTVLLDITIIFALAVGAAVVSHRLNIPSSIGVLLAGVLAGPDVLGLVKNVHQIELLSEIGVVLLLFVIGLEFSLGDLKHMRRQFLVGGSIQFFGTAAVVGAGTVLLGSTVQQSLYIGFIVALSSTAIVLKMLQERAELDAPHGRSVLAMLIYQDIAVVPVMLTAPILAGTTGNAASGDLLDLLLRVLGVAVFAIVAYRWIVPFVLGLITTTRSSEAFLLGVITLCVGIALLTQSVGLSLALGAFLAGLIISESDYSHQAVSVMLPFRDVFMSLFFISIGMLLDIQYLLANPLRIAMLTLGILLIKPVIGAIATLVLGLPLRSSILAGLAIGQVGEFSLVAARAGVNANLFGADVFQTVLDTAVLSMIATPMLVAAGPYLSDVLSRTGLVRLEKRGFSSARVGAAHAYFAHVLIVGFGVTGRNLARTARLAEVPYAILELNAGTVQSALADGEPIHFGDASQETILRHVDAEKARAIVVVIDDPAGARRIVELARRIAPEAFILVRSRYLHEVEVLRELGADEVIADELEVSIEVFSRVLTRMLVPREDIKRLIGEVRGDWRRMSRTFAKDATAAPDLHVMVPDLTTHTLRLTEHSPIVGGTIAQSALRAEHGVTVIAVTREGEQVSNPNADFTLRIGDVLFVVGPSDWDPATVM